jgi:hypothetical protein
MLKEGEGVIHEGHEKKMLMEVVVPVRESVGWGWPPA